MVSSESITVEYQKNLRPLPMPNNFQRLISFTALYTRNLKQVSRLLYLFIHSTNIYYATTKGQAMRIKNVPRHTVVNRPNNVLAPGQWSTTEEVENCEGCSGNSGTQSNFFFFGSRLPYTF